MQGFKCDKKGTYLFFFIIAVMNFIVYSPSFYHVPRADHLFYLADMAGKHDWYSLAIHSFDFSRSRTFATGDNVIFRPGAVFLLGTEKYLFGYDFFWWQVTGLILHLIVVWFLLKLLLAIHRSFFAFVLTAYFSLLFMNMENVIWHHINSILIVVSTILISLDQIYVYVYKGQTQIGRLILVAFMMTVACFTYEISNVFAVFFFIFLLFSFPSGRAKRGWSLLLLAPVGLYLLVSILNYFALGNTVKSSGNGFATIHVFLAIQQAFITIGWWLYSGLFPGQFEVIHKLGRAMLADQTVLFPAVNFLNVPFLLGLFFVLYSCMIIAIKMTKEFLKEKWKFWVLLIGMIFSWAMVISVFRIQGRGIEFALGGTLLYHYIFWVLFVVLCYSIVNFENTKKIRFLTLLKSCLVCLFIFETAVNGVLVYEMNRRIVKWHSPMRQLIQVVESLIKQEGKEPGFSFYIDSKFPGNYLYPYPLRDNDPFLKRYSFAELIYLNCFEMKNPKYLFLSDRFPGGPRIKKRF